MAETVIGTDAVVVYGLSTDTKTVRPAGSLFIEEDTGDEYSMGSSGWFLRTFGAVKTFVKYDNTTHEYYCEAAPGSALSDAAWRVSRKDLSTGFVVYAGDGEFGHEATDLATVVALTYTLGA